jgi:DNA-binding CsgD family transcriptional regulator
MTQGLTAHTSEVQPAGFNAFVGEQGGRPVLDLSTLWHDLIGGRVCIIDSFFSADRSYLSLSLEQPLRRRPRESYFRLLQTVLTGVAQKSAAIDADVAPSTVAAACKQALAYIGLDCRPSKVPPFIYLLAYAARDPKLAVNARVCDIEHPEGSFRTLAAPRLEGTVAHYLAPAEIAVMRLSLEGKSHAEMAHIRGTSIRTIANQLASVGTALRTSGRSSLIQMLIRRSYGVTTD